MFQRRIVTFYNSCRLFTNRTVYFEDGTPMYSIPDWNEKVVLDPQELKETTPTWLYDLPILEADNYLKVYNDESNT